MNILMMTNTYTPHVGGVAQSVSSFTREYRELGHNVVVVAPTYKEKPEQEKGIIRIPAIQKFNGSDFSVMLPIPGYMESQLKKLRPDIIHSHHPFLIGSTAIRAAKKYNTPLVYTHHTMYEQYTHYVPMEFPRMKEFVIHLSRGYANMADSVIAPSNSIAQLLKERGVNSPIVVIPTGVYPERFKNGNGDLFREEYHIPKYAFVIGHLGRLTPEKNLGFLSLAIIEFLKRKKDAYFLLVGYGPSKREIKEIFQQNQLQDRLVVAGKLQGKQLINAYHAMDLFAFSSKTETQGMVLAEAMSAGVPVVALKASGVMEVIENGVNGFMVETEETEVFTSVIKEYASLPPEKHIKFKTAARETAKKYSMKKCARMALELYQLLLRGKDRKKHLHDETVWDKARRQLGTEWNLMTNLATAAGEAIHKKTPR